MSRILFTYALLAIFFGQGNAFGTDNSISGVVPTHHGMTGPTCAGKNAALRVNHHAPVRTFRYNMNCKLEKPLNLGNVFGYGTISDAKSCYHCCSKLGETDLPAVYDAARQNEIKVSNELGAVDKIARKRCSQTSGCGGYTVVKDILAKTNAVCFYGSISTCTGDETWADKSNARCPKRKCPTCSYVPPPPTVEPTAFPTSAPTESPTSTPTGSPTIPPTEVPTMLPTMSPTNAPTVLITRPPTPLPTAAPSKNPCVNDTNSLHPEYLTPQCGCYKECDYIESGIFQNTIFVIDISGSMSSTMCPLTGPDKLQAQCGCAPDKGCVSYKNKREQPGCVQNGMVSRLDDLKGKLIDRIKGLSSNYGQRFMLVTFNDDVTFYGAGPAHDQLMTASSINKETAIATIKGWKEGGNTAMQKALTAVFALNRKWAVDDPTYDPQSIGMVLLSDGEPDSDGKLDTKGGNHAGRGAGQSTIVNEQGSILELSANGQIITSIAKKIHMPISTIVWTVGGSYDIQSSCARNRAFEFMRNLAGVTNCVGYDIRKPDVCVNDNNKAVRLPVDYYSDVNAHKCMAHFGHSCDADADYLCEEVKLGLEQAQGKDCFTRDQSSDGNTLCEAGNIAACAQLKQTIRRDQCHYDCDHGVGGRLPGTVAIVVDVSASMGQVNNASGLNIPSKLSPNYPDYKRCIDAGRGKACQRPLTRLELVQNQLIYSLSPDGCGQALDSTQNFSLVWYSSGIKGIYPNPKQMANGNNYVHATDANLNKALAHIEGWTFEGVTNTQAALEYVLALDPPPNTILFYSDGMPTGTDGRPSQNLNDDILALIKNYRQGPPSHHDTRILPFAFTGGGIETLAEKLQMVKFMDQISHSTEPEGLCKDCTCQTANIPQPTCAGLAQVGVQFTCPACGKCPGLPLTAVPGQH